MRVRLNQRGAMAFEEALLGVMLTLGCIGGFLAISYSVRGVISEVFGEYNSFGLGFSCNDQTCPPDFRPVDTAPLTSDLTPNGVSPGIGQPGSPTTP